MAKPVTLSLWPPAAFVPDLWLRWQLTKRGGYLWHETCATCAAWIDAGDDGYGDCGNPSGLHQLTHANDVCSLYEPREEGEPCAS